MTAVFINPQLYVQKNDKFTTGIVYMPIALAYVVSYFKKQNIETNVIDLYGENPKKFIREENCLIFGENIVNISKNKLVNAKCFFIYANQVANHLSVITIAKFLKKNYLNIPVVILENSQAVTAYSLSKVKDEFLNIGCDYIVIGDIEKPALSLYNNLNDINYIKNIKGLISKNINNNKIDFIEDLNKIDFPAWEDFPLKNYWDLGYSHGPLSSNKYLPILSSRGCPYPCNFCVVPKTNERKWRARNADNILKEIKHWKNKFDVTEFHFEDLNPTVNDKRTKEFCNLVIKEKIDFTWKIVAGTKVESIKDAETIELLAKSGCKYISISPESGSSEMMKEINKPFNYQHALKSVKKMNIEKIFTQACFVIGYPGEKKTDLKKTRKMIFDLTKRGIDEIAVFIITPIPGSKIYEEFKGFSSLSGLTFTPIWRKDYRKLSRERLIMYSIFLCTKIFFHPIKIFKQTINFIKRRFDTKMEMVPYKVLKLNSFENGKK